MNRVVTDYERKKMLTDRNEKIPNEINRKWIKMNYKMISYTFYKKKRLPKESFL